MMSDGRFFSILLAAFAAGILSLLLLFNWLQRPEGLDRSLMTTLLGFVGPIVAVLLNNMANTKQAADIRKAQEEIKQTLATKL